MAFLETKWPKINVVLMLLFCTYSSKAQSEYSKYAIGINLGVNTTFADLAIKKQTFGGALSFQYFFNENIAIALDGQLGVLAGGSRSKDLYGREFKNSYQALSLGAKISLATFIGETENATVEAMKLLYVGAGFGAINNRLVDVVRQSPNGAGDFAGTNKSINLLVPLSIGIFVPVKDKYGDSKVDLSLAYQSNLTFGEGLDGYGDTGIKLQNKHIDIFNAITLGLRLRIGSQSYW